MIRCKHVADALAETNFRDMARLRRWGAMVHVFLCPCCGRFHRDVIRAQENAREYRDLDEYTDAELSADGRDCIRRMLQTAQDSTHQDPGQG